MDKYLKRQTGLFKIQELLKEYQVTGATNRQELGQSLYNSKNYRLDDLIQLTSPYALPAHCQVPQVINRLGFRGDIRVDPGLQSDIPNSRGNCQFFHEYPRPAGGRYLLRQFRYGQYLRDGGRAAVQIQAPLKKPQLLRPDLILI